MSVKKVEMYTLVCDGCGKDVCDNEEYSSWNDKGFLKEIASEAHWQEIDDKDYCTDCYEFDSEDNLIVVIN